MKITFLGAQEGVTGSCYYLQTDIHNFLIDCGQFQGNQSEEKKNLEPFPFEPKDLDFVILTHGHIDHTGRLPKLVQQGFHGKVFLTRGTASLSEILLNDSAKIHAYANELENEKRKKAGLDLVPPFYTAEDVTNTLQYFYPLAYNQPHKENGLIIEFMNAGHLLGSAHVSIKYQKKHYLFSGDIGTDHSQILKPTDGATPADYIFMETTYGTKNHTEINERFHKLIGIIEKATQQGGTVIIPAFSVGRTQDIIYGIKELNALKDIDIYIDSPMAIHGTKVFETDTEGMKDELVHKIMSGQHPFNMKNIHFIDDATTSFQLNFKKEPKVLISASGMCDAGRILHHLKAYLPKTSTHILFVGYQGTESLGRRIQNKEPIEIYGEAVENNSTIHTLSGFSGHADQNELMKWLFKSQPQKIFLVHGEKESLTTMAQKIKERYKIETYIPQLYETIEI